MSGMGLGTGFLIVERWADEWVGGWVVSFSRPWDERYGMWVGVVVCLERSWCGEGVYD